MGKVPSYPASQEAFDRLRAATREQALRLIAEGKFNRRGVPDGWAGRKAELTAIRAKAADEAKEIVALMREKELIEGEDPRGDDAIEEAVAIYRACDDTGKFAHTVKDRLAAIKIVAEFCKAKPVSRSQTKISAAEDFLGVLAGEVSASKAPKEAPLREQRPEDVWFGRPE